MLFNSVEFIVFFPFVVLCYFIMPLKWRNAWLLLTSYIFYMSWDARFIFIIMYVTMVTYLGGMAIGRMQGRKRKWVLAAGLCLDFAVLLWFKYFMFLFDSLQSVLQMRNITLAELGFTIILPVGISFFTFQTAGYLVDVYRGEVQPEKRLGTYALFVAFFPQLVAGPIERSRNLLKQCKVEHRFEEKRVKEGLLIMGWGFFLKLVIADRIAQFVDSVYGNVESYQGWYFIVATLLFSLQLYCDFAGYSTIAVGAARVLGFSLMDNFEAPFFSQSTAELWRRWHRSLSDWFKYYLYFPLGGSRKGTVRKYVNLLIVYLVSGLWHGANWTFVMWGLWNGIFRVMGEISKPMVNKVWDKMAFSGKTVVRTLSSIVITFLLFSFTMIYFRADNMTDVGIILRRMWDISGMDITMGGALFTVGLSKANFVVLLVAIFVLFVGDLLKYRNVNVLEIVERWWLPVRWAVYIGGLLVITIFGIYGNGNSSFIYFAF